MESLEVWSDLVSMVDMEGATESPMVQRGVLLMDVDGVEIRRAVRGS